MALVAGRVHGDGVLALHVRRPVTVDAFLHPVDVELRGQFRPGLAHDIEVVQGASTDIDAAEELPVQVAVEPSTSFLSEQPE